MTLDNLFDQDPAALRCPFGEYGQSREQGVHFSEKANAYLVTRYEQVVQILRDDKTFSSSNTLGAPAPPEGSEMSKYLPYLLLSDNPEHARRRSIVNRALTPSHVAHWEPLIRSTCAGMVDALAGAKDVDFLPALAGPLPMAVILQVLGIPLEGATAIREWSDGLVFATVGVDVFSSDVIVSAGKPFAAYISSLLDDAGGGQRDDILSVIAAAEANGELSRDDATRFVIDLMVAGNFTTTAYLASSMLMLARNRGLAERLRANPELISRFVDEMLRLEAPIQGFYRLTTVDCEIGGVPIPAGARLLVFPGSANRDPAVWTNADNIDLSRPNAASHLTFSRGSHACLGAPLVRLQAQLVLEMLLSRTENIELTIDDVPYLPNAIFRLPLAIPLRITWKTNTVGEQ